MQRVNDCEVLSGELTMSMHKSHIPLYPDISPTVFPPFRLYDQHYPQKHPNKVIPNPTTF